MHKKILRTVPLWACLIGGLAGCHQDQGQEVTLKPEPSRNPLRESVPAHPPIVKGELATLPELMVEMNAGFKGESPLPVDTAALAVNKPMYQDKRAQLSEITNGNKALAEKIRKLEQELQRKDQVSRQISQKIEGLKARN